ncbi:MAG: 50S ribosomal protein L25 [Calditrichaeota bacterium]|nr:50S ribosomal protein L25 [Calditrichota bacterium]
MSDSILNASTRASGGKGAARKTRAAGLVPGVFYYHDENIPVEVDRIDLSRLLRGRHKLVSLAIDGTGPRECVFRELQRHPVSGDVLHFDLLGVKRGERVTVTVPVRLTGTPVGVKEGGGILEHGVSEISIECEPGDIPDFIEVDVAALAIGHSIHVSDLDYPQLRFHQDPHTVVAHVASPTLVREESARAAIEGAEGATPAAEAAKSE